MSSIDVPIDVLQKTVTLVQWWLSRRPRQSVDLLPHERDLIELVLETTAVGFTT